MANPNRKDARYLISAASGYTERLLDRLMIENQGLSVVNTPIGGIEGVERLKDFWGYARDGFRMTFRMDREGRSNINPTKLLAATQEVNINGIWEEIYNITGTKPNLETAQNTPALVVFGHTLVTIGHLSRLGSVSIASLEPNLRGRRIGYLGQQTTDWRRNLDPESVWFLVGQLETDSMTALYYRGRFNRDSVFPLLRAAHFFAAGVNIAEDLKAA